MNRATHKCIRACHSCRDMTCKPIANFMWLKCDRCRRFFKGETCKRLHLLNRTCETIQRCDICLLSVRLGEHHECGLRPCSYCKQMVDKDHLCYIQKPNPPPNSNAGQGPRHNIALTTNNKRCKKIPDNPPIIFYFDFEAMQEVLENAQENNMIRCIHHACTKCTIMHAPSTLAQE